jgi:hypothetical protein
MSEVLRGDLLAVLGCHDAAEWYTFTTCTHLRQMIRELCQELESPFFDDQMRPLFERAALCGDVRVTMLNNKQHFTCRDRCDQ